MKHYEKRRSVSGRLFVLMLALVLVLGCAVGGTVAWLVAKTDPVVNTFTYGDINITLTETTGEDYKIIPGVDIGKDPKVTVKAGSEACWLFVKVEEEGTFVANKVTYSVDDGWTQGNDTDIPLLYPQRIRSKIRQLWRCCENRDKVLSGRFIRRGLHARLSGYAGSQCV